MKQRMKRDYFFLCYRNVEYPVWRKYNPSPPRQLRSLSVQLVFYQPLHGGTCPQSTVYLTS